LSFYKSEKEERENNYCIKSEKKDYPINLVLNKEKLLGNDNEVITPANLLISYKYHGENQEPP